MGILKITSRKIFILSILVATLMIFSMLGGLTTNFENGVTNHTKTSEPALSEKLPSLIKNNQTKFEINPYQHYSNEPAPMGLADFGIGPNNTPYAYNTTSFRGAASINSLVTDSNNTTIKHYMTFQFNVNLAFNYSGHLYVYWVQDVAFVNTSNNFIYFIDNIWNMSSSSASMQSSTLTGNGTLGNSSGTEYYYSYANQYLPGNCVNLKYPSNAKFMINSTVDGGVPEVDFMYNDGYGWVTYDNVFFKFVTNISESCDYGFVVDGQTYEPEGYSFYDAELILGGPGGGSSTTDNQSNVNLTIQYWNGHNYQEISNAFNFGADTAETIGNVVSNSYYFIHTGNLFEKVTAGQNGSLGRVYSSSDISFLNISTPFSSGTVYVNGSAHSFVGGDINLTLAPGHYQLKIYNNSVLYNSTIVDLSAGEYLPLEVDMSLVTFTITGLPQGTIWWVNLTDHSYSSSTNTISFYEDNGTYPYTIQTANKTYEPSMSTGSLKVDGKFIPQSVQFSKVTYKATFTETGLLSGIMWYVNGTELTGHNTSPINITFMLTNGTYTFTITNLSSYYTTTAHFTITIDGRNMTETVYYCHWVYITGTISPVSATLTINGITVHVLPSGDFNVSVANGTSYIVASEIGYQTYHHNVTLNSGRTNNVTINLKPVSNPSLTPGIAIYALIGVVAIIAVAGVTFVLRKRK